MEKIIKIGKTLVDDESESLEVKESVKRESLNCVPAFP